MIDRRALRRALGTAYPWVQEHDRGPRSVEAGECDRCGQRPRLLPTCGPVRWTAVCRDCAREVGDDAWCEGHAELGRELRRWAAELPPEWAAVCRAWWIATGEVRLDPSLAEDLGGALPAPVRALLPGPG